jgi:uncharacterized protein
VTTFYVDTSAAVKLVVAEHGSRPLERWASVHDENLVSSDLLRTELLRAVRRGAPRRMERARAVLDALTIVTLPTSTFERAAEIEPVRLRSLDSLHLAAALELGDELDGIVTFDDRLADAARSYGVNVVSPG